MNKRKEFIERFYLTGPINEAEKAFDWCLEHGFHITRSGPMLVGKRKVDTTRYKLIAERKS